tara:strand:- start:43071 stop:43382 length:312 start_codon:yes stop_codon:yes gene_type:complete
MCSTKLKKIIKKVDPLMGGDKILDDLGLPSVFGDEQGFVQEPIEMGASQVAAAPDAPTEVDGGVLAARDDERRRRAAAAGQNSTILTGGLGSANTGQKTLLGA